MARAPKNAQIMTSDQRLKHIRKLEKSIEERDAQFAALRDARDKDREYISSLEQRLAEKAKWYIEAETKLQDAKDEIDALGKLYNGEVKKHDLVASALREMEKRAEKAERKVDELTAVKNQALLSAMSVDRALKDAFEHFGRGFAEGMQR